MLLSGFGSVVVLVAVAVLVNAWAGPDEGARTVATTSSVFVVAAGTEPSVQTPEPALYEPADGVAETNCSPAGRRSVTATLWAVLGPTFSSVMVKVTLSPTLGAVSLTVLETIRSAS